MGPAGGRNLLKTTLVLSIPALSSLVLVATEFHFSMTSAQESGRLSFLDPEYRELSLEGGNYLIYDEYSTAWLYFITKLDQ